MIVINKPGKNTRNTLLGHSAAIFLIRLAPALAAMVALVLLSRSTTAEFYGRYQAFWVQWQVLNTIACIGLPSLIFTYPPEQITSLLRGVKTSQIAGFLSWIAGISLLFCFLQLLSGKALLYPALTLLFLFSSVTVALCEVYLITYWKYKLVVTGSVVYALLFMGGHWALLKEWMSINELFMLLVLGNCIRFLVLGLASNRLYKKNRSDQQAIWRGGVTSLWKHLALYDGVQMLFRWVDKLVLSFLLTAPVFALYFNGTVDIPFLPLLLGAAGSAVLMQLNQTKQTDEARLSLIKDAGCILSRIVFPMFFFLVFFRQELFGVMLRHRYDGATTLFLISSLTVPLRAYSFTSILQHSGKGKIINMGAMLDLVLALILAGPLYLVFRLNGIAIAFVISTWFQAGFYLYHTARTLQVKMVHLLPVRSWGIQLVSFSVLFAGLNIFLDFYFDEQLILILGAGSLMFTIILSLLPVLLSRSTSGNGPQF